MRTKASKLGKNYVYYSPFIDQLCVVTKLPATPNLKEIHKAGYYCEFGPDFKNINGMIYLYPEAAIFYRTDNFEFNYDGLVYVGEL